MKHLAKVLALVMALALAFGLVACGHEHTAGSEWKSDKTNHWHTCTECDEVMDEAAHTPGEWQIDAESGITVSAAVAGMNRIARRIRRTMNCILMQITPSSGTSAPSAAQK